MKILYVTDQFYMHGGVEKMLCQKINYWLQHYQYEVILCTSEQRNKNFIYELNPSTNHIDLGINYHRTKSYFHPLNLLKAVVHFVKLKGIIKAYKPDVIISVNYTPEQYFIPFLANTIPTIKEFHSSGVLMQPQTSFFEKCKYRLFLILNRYTVKVVLNEDEKKYYPFKGIEVIPNFIVPQMLEKELKENVIIVAGRIAPVKQLEHLIEAWAKIAHEIPDWEVHIYGEGDLQIIQKLQYQINQLQVPRIVLKGATKQLEKQMQRAKIFAMTSATECFPMVLLEAQAAGMAVISYDCPNGPRNIITHEENGILVENQNKDAFAQELKQLITNTTKQSKIKNNAKQSSAKFSQHTIMRKWNALCNSI